MEREHAINIIELAKIKLPSIADKISEAVATLSAPSWISYADNPPQNEGRYLFLIDDKHVKYGGLMVEIASFQKGKYQGSFHMQVMCGMAEVIGYIPIPNYQY